MKIMKGLSLFGICFAFVVIALGAWTRLVDAGLGCPDWPGCYGFVVFPTTEAEIQLAESRYPQFPYEIDKAIPEVVHRYFAAALGFLAILLVYFAFKYQLPKKIKAITSFLLFFICCQGLFGYLTVSLKLLPIIVTGHLFGGFITLSLFFYLFLNTTNGIKNHNIGHLKVLGGIALFALIVQIFLGVWTSTNYASLACADFPTCQGKFIPEMDFREGFNLAQEVGPNYLYGLLDNEARVAIHYSHRISAIVLTIIFLILISRLWFSSAAPLASTLGVILITQISLGIMNVVYVLPLYIAIAHNLVAALLLLATLMVNLVIWKNE
jgi:cytochrome c oxidase assembly protein subunit 15|tara:strand:+ start:513 stop:1484 length:972 start_codon:yes stop_codon:yes gene_type:complete